MANSLKWDVKYTHSSISIRWEYTLLTWLYYNSSCNLKLKIMERNFFIAYQLVQSSISRVQNKKSILEFLSQLPSRRLRRKAPFGVQGDTPWPLWSVTIQLTSQSSRENQAFQEIGQLGLHSLKDTPLSPSRIFPSWTPTPLTAYLVSQPNSPSLAHVYHKLPFSWMNIRCPRYSQCLIHHLGSSHTN